jgi:hypothetical protein
MYRVSDGKDEPKRPRHQLVHTPSEGYGWFTCASTQQVRSARVGRMKGYVGTLETLSEALSQS